MKLQRFETLGNTIDGKPVTFMLWPNGKWTKADEAEARIKELEERVAYYASYKTGWYNLYDANENLLAQLAEATDLLEKCTKKLIHYIHGEPRADILVKEIKAYIDKDKTK